MLRVPAGSAGREPLFSTMVVAHAPDVRTSLGLELARLGAHPLHEADSSAEAMACAVTGGVRELALVDLDLPDGSALRLVGDLRARGWPSVVVLATAGGPGDAEAAFRLGARGYLVKTARGGDPAPGPVTGADGLLRELSGREVQVLQLVAHGRSNKEVGEQLGLSSLTIKRHLSRISLKLGTGDRAQMVALSMRAGIIA